MLIATTNKGEKITHTAKYATFSYIGFKLLHYHFKEFFTLSCQTKDIYICYLETYHLLQQLKVTWTVADVALTRRSGWSEHSTLMHSINLCIKNPLKLQQIIGLYS